MRQKRNMLQTNQQGQNPQNQINEEEIGNLHEKIFRVMIEFLQLNIPIAIYYLNKCEEIPCMVKIINILI